MLFILLNDKNVSVYALGCRFAEPASQEPLRLRVGAQDVTVGANASILMLDTVPCRTPQSSRVPPGGRFIQSRLPTRASTKTGLA